MKKTLKKVISAVIALAVAGSLVPATFAAKLTLTDVADTAAYATAVNTLVALDVVNGYEDNTFLPENLITRAEVTKIVVAAHNQLAAADGMASKTGFTDVADDFWANGVINVGVQKGFINGMGDGTFAPQANVTFAQIVKMLVASMGYEEYAQYLGGWPNGYIAIANAEGVTDGVKANANDAVTRAQVAQLVYNAMNTPIVENVGMEYSAAGILVPKIEKMDGQNNKFYKTLLTENFDAYMVEGYVLETPKAATATLKNDQIVFGIAKSADYDVDDVAFDVDKAVSNIAVFDDEDNSNKIIVNVGDTDAADYLGVYGTAIVMIDEYEDYTLISYQPSGKNKSVELAADLIDEDKTDFDSDVMYFYPSATATKSTKYELNETIKLYVNGVAVDVNAENLAKYVVNNDTTTVTLIDTYKTDGKYDTIKVDYYLTAMVKSVSSGSKLYLDGKTGSGVKNISLNKEDNKDLEYTITLNGEAIELSALKKDDVVSIAYDVSAEGGIDASDFYTILVSRDVKTGMLTAFYEDKEYAIIGDKEYKFINLDETTIADMNNTGTEYTLWVDAFGKIYDYEENTTNTKYGVIHKVKDSSACAIELYTTEGTLKTYEIDVNKAKVYTVTNPTTAVAKTSIKSTLQDIVGAEYSQNDVDERVVEYNVASSTGKIIELRFLEASASTAALEGSVAEFDSRKNRIAGVYLASATKIINAAEYVADGYASVNMKVMSLGDLVDETKYEAYAFGSEFSAGGYPLVVICQAGSAYSETTRFAVVANNGAALKYDENEDETYEISALYEGKATTLVASDEVTTVKNLKKGDVIIFKTDARGYIDEYEIIFQMSEDGVIADYDDMVKESITDGDSFIKFTNEGNVMEDFVSGWYTNQADKIQLVYGPIVDKQDRYMSLGLIDEIDLDDAGTAYSAAYLTNLDHEIASAEDKTGYASFDISDATNVYVYDYSLSRNQLGTDTEYGTGAIIASSIADDFIVEFEDEEAGLTYEYINWTKIAAEDKIEDVTFALALVVDGEAVDVLVFANN